MNTKIKTVVQLKRIFNWWLCGVKTEEICKFNNCSWQDIVDSALLGIKKDW